MSDPKPARANPLTGLHKGHPTSTPIPPSLQAKMAAFANRPGVGALPVLHPASSFPAPPKPNGMAARRARPNFSLRDIDPAFIPLGPVASGLGAGRPSLFQEPPRRPPPAGNFGSPFSNFSKIVSVLFSLSPSSVLPPLINVTAIPLVLSTSTARQSSMQPASISQAVLPLLSTWISSGSTKSLVKATTAQ